MSAPTLEALAFWRGMVAQAVARPTQANAAALRKLGERARQVQAPGWKIPGQLAMFRAFNIAARGYAGDAGALLALADQVQAAIAAPPCATAGD